jgi:hypothetical protein
MKSFEGPPTQEKAPESQLVNGERIGVSAESFKAYVSEIRRIYPESKDVSVVVGEWKPEESRLPHHTTLYAASTEREGKRELHIAAVRPDEVHDEQIRWIFGEALPQTMGAAWSPRYHAGLRAQRRQLQQALDTFVEGRDRAKTLLRIEEAVETVEDEGLRAVYQKALQLPSNALIVPMIHMNEDAAFLEAYNLLALLPILVHSKTLKAIAEKMIRERVSSLNAMWKKLDEADQKRIRVGLDRCIQ